MACTFAIPEWETNTVATNSSKGLFKRNPPEKKQETTNVRNKLLEGKFKKRLKRQFNDNKNHTLNINETGYNNRNKPENKKFSQQSKLLKNKKVSLTSSLKKKKKNVILKTQNICPKTNVDSSKSQAELKPVQNQKFNNIRNQNKDTRIVSAIKKAKSFKNKDNIKLKQEFTASMEHTFKANPSNSKKILNTSLRERMLDKLMGARFRFLNEQLYTSKGDDAMKYFKRNPNDYAAYHDGYRHQVSKWPLNPVDIIIKDIKKLPNDKIIADFGCGEAKLAQSVPHQVYSFDLIASNELVTVCDMAHVSLESKSVDVVVFCLSLMGTNLKDYILEANRVLRMGGLLKIAEVESRFSNVNDFMSNIEKFGFVKKKHNLSHNLFCFIDFIKKDEIKQKKKLSNLHLSPCLYKKR